MSTLDSDLEYCCEPPNQCYQHLVMNGLTCKEAIKVIADREKLEKEITPKIGPSYAKASEGKPNYE